MEAMVDRYLWIHEHEPLIVALFAWVGFTIWHYYKHGGGDGLA